MTVSAKLVVFACVFLVAACASSRRIDGSSAATFERSVAMLQNDLPPRRRGELDIALAVIFMRSAGLDSGDLDADGDVDYFDARIVSDTATNLLAEIQRGNLTSAAEQSKGRAVAAAYFEHLDGLGYADVVELAGGQDTGPHVADMRRQMSQAACSAVAWKGDVRPPPLGNTSRIRRCD